MRIPLLYRWTGLGIAARIVLVFVLVFGAMGSVGLLLLRHSLLPTFEEMERTYAQQSAKRILRGLEEQMELVSTLSRDWARWDALYDHMQRPDPVFVRSNIGPAAMQESSLHAVLLLDAQGHAKGFGARPFSNAEKVNVAELTEVVHPRWLSQGDSAALPECGLTHLSRTLTAVCWKGIVRSDGSGPVRGVVVMAREVDAGALAAVAQYAGVGFTMDSPDSHDGEDPPGAHWDFASRQNLAGNTLDVRFQPDALNLAFELLDVQGRPLSDVHIHMDRKLMKESTGVLTSVGLQLAGLALICGLVLLYTVHRWLVRPIANMRHRVETLSATRQWQQALPYERPDEVGALTIGINSLLAVLSHQVKALETLSTTDALTGMPNRRAFDERLDQELVRLGRRTQPLSLLLVDVDHFKNYNDHYGHPAGDVVLRDVGGLLSEICREQDLPARLGGEEFALLLPDTDVAGAEALADKVRAALEARNWPHVTSPTCSHLTVSIGIATWSARLAGGASRLIAEADKALYAAKHGGRNRACTYGTPGVPKL